ncbi:MAG: MMPL family transporter [Bacteroidota bacterium]
MWFALAKSILKNRFYYILVILGITIFMGYHARNVRMSYEIVRMLPENDTALLEYNEFKGRFGEDGNVLVVGVNNPNMFRLKDLKSWYDLGNDIRAVEGVEEVASICRMINIVKDTSTHSFIIKPVMQFRPETQGDADSLKRQVLELPFYKGLLFNPDSNAYLMAITLNKAKLNDKIRVDIVNKISRLVVSYGKKAEIKVHFSGLPYIRTVTTQKVKDELNIFIYLSLLITSITLILFFRSVKSFFFPLIIVAIGIVWTLGIISLFGFKITILTGILPSLLVVIGMENCIYLLNKYHWEYKNHGNKIKALSRVVHRIGFATLITNMTTALGFATFIFTENLMLKEFGIVSSISIIAEYLLSIVLIPIIFSYLKPPQARHVKHIDGKFVQSMIGKIKYIIIEKRPWVFGIGAIIIFLSIYGMTWMRISGKLVDDLPPSDPIFKDLKYFERNFNGVMPFEISIDTKRKNGVMKLSTFRKIDALQDSLALFPELSKPLSIAELVKFAKQSFYGGSAERYSLPNNQEIAFLSSYLPKMQKGNAQFKSFIDSTKRFTRISVQSADIGTKEMNKIKARLRPMIDSIFNPEDYNVVVTGNSVVYTKGTEFLIGNLIESVFIGILLISLLMAIVFQSFRMIFIAVGVNLIPLIITAGIMGYGHIPLKPSTLIVFSIALGIAIDNAILFLSRYRFEIKYGVPDVKEAVIIALNESGISIIYTSIVLILGFAVYMVSGFGGTQALGMLISITLFFALFFNIIFLPSLILSFSKNIVTKAFTDPMIDIYDEEEDIDLEELKIRKNTPIEEFENKN